MTSANPPKAFLFDVFGTLVDWRTGIAHQCAAVFGKKKIEFNPHEFADLWRGEYVPAMGKIRQGNRGYVPLDILHLENLESVLNKTGLQSLFSDDEKALLNQAWEKLPPWPDTIVGLQKLRNLGLIAPCSNGSIALMARLARFAEFPWDAILGADIAGNYKPEPDVYLASCAALGLPPSSVMMIAAHNSDLVAAREAGLRTGFIARPSEHGPDQKTDLSPAQNWDVHARDLNALATLLST